MKVDSIDNGKAFDWGKTSDNYAKYRDIYPKAFYEKILSCGVGLAGQKILDIGTGTGVLPRNMYHYGAAWTGSDIAENQIIQARRLAAEQGMNISFFTSPAEEIDFPENTFDAITACQCIWYPNHKVLAPNVAKMLKSGGKFLILYMGWLPFEDEIAAKSEELILKYNPSWTGCGDTRHHVWVPDEYLEYFDVSLQEEFDAKVPFTRESWHGRMRACRGVEASMTEDILSKWDAEHKAMLEEYAEESFEILHYISIAELVRK
ncbi:MAG: class I SAM-dependent methyltransferase [Lachnospiraceae bacterium]|nr:class I SAM-dependent methyltransferase [Lachnospiraceae bacterium]